MLAYILCTVKTEVLDIKLNPPANPYPGVESELRRLTQDEDHEKETFINIIEQEYNKGYLLL